MMRMRSLRSKSGWFHPNERAAFRSAWWPRARPSSTHRITRAMRQGWRSSATLYMTDIFKFFEYVLDKKVITTHLTVMKKAHWVVSITDEWTPDRPRPNMKILAKLIAAAARLVDVFETIIIIIVTQGRVVNGERRHAEPQGGNDHPQLY